MKINRKCECGEMTTKSVIKISRDSRVEPCGYIFDQLYVRCKTCGLIVGFRYLKCQEENNFDEEKWRDEFKKQRSDLNKEFEEKNPFDIYIKNKF